MGTYQDIQDITIEQNICVEKGTTHLVLPTNITFLSNITVYGDKEIPNFFYKPTIPFDNRVPRTLRIGVTIFEKKDEYCSELSELKFDENIGKYCRSLDINNNTMKKLWNLLENSSYENLLLQYQLNENDGEYVKNNVLMTSCFDYMSVVFEEPLLENNLLIKYNGKNIKKN